MKKLLAVLFVFFASINACGPRGLEPENREQEGPTSPTARRCIFAILMNMATPAQRQTRVNNDRNDRAHSTPPMLDQPARKTRRM